LLNLVPENSRTLDLVGNNAASAILRLLADSLCKPIGTNNLQKVVPSIQARINTLLYNDH
ncbi:hypothetical protein BX616_007823, partial [Lobosporangium transversale]